MSQEPAECSLVRRDTSSLEPPLSPLECLRKVARRFGLLDAPPPPVPQKESEPQQPGNVQRGEPPPTATWWTLLPLEPSKYERVVVFDTETSGFSGEDEILEIGAVELEVCSPSPGASYAILRPTGVSFHSLLQTSREIHAKAAQVNGLCQKDLEAWRLVKASSPGEAAMPRPLAIRSFLRFLAGEKTALVAHNAAFDLRTDGRERLTAQIELKGQQQVEKERQRLEEVLQRRGEIVEKHEKAMAKITQEHESSLRAMVRRTEDDLAESLHSQQRADEECRVMQHKAAELERRKSILEKEVKRLHCLLDKLQKDFEQRRLMMVGLADQEVNTSFSQTAEEVKTTSLFAQEVQLDAFMSIDRMKEEIKASAEVADAMAESRSRFDSYTAIHASRTVKGISEQNFANEKQKIVEKWWSHWERHIDSLSPGPPSLAQIAASRPDTPMVPTQNRPRSVETARQKADMQMRLRLQRGNGALQAGKEDRPKTAP
ncbi:unnamed protein product [Effrenium voratum]|nr:unnamed protein product [Effrenium voratum]